MTSRRNPLFFIALSTALVVVPSYGADRKSTKAPTTKTAEVVNADVTSPAPKSVFTVDKGFRDPFFPKSSRPRQPDTAPVPASTSMDVVSMLRAGFQGIMGAGENRLAVINNAIIESGKIVTVPLGPSGSGKTVRLRVVEILKDSVTIEIEGQKQPLTLTAGDSK